MRDTINTALLGLLLLAVVAAGAVLHVDAQRAHRDAESVARDRADMRALVGGMNDTLNVIASNTSK